MLLYIYRTLKKIKYKLKQKFKKIIIKYELKKKYKKIELKIEMNFPEIVYFLFLFSSIFLVACWMSFILDYYQLPVQVSIEGKWASYDYKT